jgi:hypothetical protein
MAQTWLDKPRGNWWTKEAVGSVTQANVSKGVEVDGVTQMMIAAYKQWADLEVLINAIDEDFTVDHEVMAKIKDRHSKYKLKIDQAAAWRAGVSGGVMTPEGELKKEIKEELNWWTPLWYYMPVSCGFGKQGIPDFIICANGRFLSIETKDKGKKRTPLQNLQNTEITLAQGIALLIFPEEIENVRSYLGCAGVHNVQLLPNNKLAIRVRDPNVILTLIPHATLHKDNVLTMPHRLEETKVLRNLGIKVPAPIISNYDWPRDTRQIPQPFHHQIETAAFMTMNRKCFVLLDMGLGKTIASLWAADWLMKQGIIRKVLILSTLSTLDITWQRELFRNLMHRKSMVVHGTKHQRMCALTEDVDFFIMNHHGMLVMGDELPARNDIDLVILDEASMVRNSQTKIYKALKKYLRPDQWLWLLTGRPCPGGPVDAWALAQLVSPDRVPKFFTRWKDETMRKVSMFKWVPREGSTQRMHDAMQPAIRFAKKDLPRSAAGHVPRSRVAHVGYAAGVLQHDEVADGDLRAGAPDNLGQRGDPPRQTAADLCRGGEDGRGGVHRARHGSASERPRRVHGAGAGQGHRRCAVHRSAAPCSRTRSQDLQLRDNRR